MRDINEVAKKMARNGLKIAKSLGCAFHFESQFMYVQNIENTQNFLDTAKNNFGQAGHISI